MSLAPLLSAPLHIQIHAMAAMLAIGLGPIALYRTRRDIWHKTSGYLWVLAMAVTALSSFTITNFGMVGPFSPIHLLAVFALWSLYQGMREVFACNIKAHAATMRSLYWRGLMVAGLFNFLPGRTMNRVFLNDAREVGYVVIAVGVLALLVHGLRPYLRRSAMG